MITSAILPASTVPNSLPLLIISADHFGPLDDLHGLDTPVGMDGHLLKQVKSGDSLGVGVTAGDQMSAGVNEHLMEPQCVLIPFVPPLAHGARHGRISVWGERGRYPFRGVIGQKV